MSISYNKSNQKYIKPSLQHIHSYWANVIPSLEQLRKELICPVNINHPKYSKYMTLLSDIHRLQFKQSQYQCYNNATAKYIIVENPCWDRGLFAGMWCWIYFLSEALLSNRTLLFHGKYSFATTEYCSNFTTAHTTDMECFFLPVTSCNNVTHLLLTHVYNSIDNSTILLRAQDNIIPESVQRILPSDTNLFSWSFVKKFDEVGNNRIVYVASDRSRGMLGKIRYYKKFANKYELEMDEFVSLLAAYLLRQQPYIQREVSLGVLHSLTSLNHKWDPYNTVSAIVRWSDKCWQFEYKNIKSANPEMDCFEIDEYLEITQKLKQNLMPNIMHTIVTSESKIIIDKSKKKQKEVDYEFIFNLNDVMQGGSELRFAWLNEKHAINIMVSMLSSIKLQFGAKYYFLKSGSSWNKYIWSMANSLDCIPISSKELNDVETDIDSVQITKQQFRKFYEHIKVMENQVNERMCIYLDGDISTDKWQGNKLHNGSHVVEWNMELTQLKNSKFSEEYDWDYISSAKTYNLWNGTHCS